MANQPTLEDLAKLIQEGVAAALAADKATRKAKGGGRKPLTEEEKAKNRAKSDMDAIAAFKAAGYKNVKPRENVRTFNQWLLNGRLVKKGKSIRVGRWSLWHFDDTTPATQEKPVVQDTVH